jgi:DNA invertase Pin-like site-specific DNA recombinase
MISSVVPAVRRACIYARVSTRKEEQARALEGHQARLRQFIGARGFALEERHVYMDNRSGATDDRPAYQAMKAAARARQIDVVVTTKLDRLARSVRELIGLVAELDALGVDLVVIDQAIDTTTPAGKLLFHVLAAVAEFERDLVRDRVRRGLDQAREKGVKLGRPSPVVDLAEVARLRAEGRGLREIARMVTGMKGDERVNISATWLSRHLKGAGKSGDAAPAA